MNISKYILPVLLLGLLTMVTTSCDDTFDNNREIDFSLVPDPFPVEGAEKVEKESGVTYYVVEEGSGDFKTEIRDGIRVFITGREKETGTIFDSSYGDQSTTPRTYNTIFTINGTGLREGLLDMKVGEKRVIIIPPGLGNNNPLFRFRNDTLRYDVELDEILL